VVVPFGTWLSVGSYPVAGPPGLTYLVDAGGEEVN